METKKSSKANLEKGKSMSLMMGFIVAMALLFVAFEWGTADVKVMMADMDGNIEWVDEIPISLPEPPPPPPPPPKVMVLESINIVDKPVDTKDNPLITTEDLPDTPQPETYLPPTEAPEEEEDATTIFRIVEDMPAFPGGDAALLGFISKSIKYPVVAQENGVQGRVVCSFVINTDGSIVDAEIVRGIDPSLDKEALRVISAMPKWEPGRQRGKAVRVRYTMPIMFRLQ